MFNPVPLDAFGGADNDDALFGDDGCDRPEGGTELRDSGKT